jgi:hypothetical protein
LIFFAFMVTAISAYAGQDWKRILAADYSDRQLGKDTYSVNFTDKQTIGDGELRYLMALHYSELALANGYRYFRVVDGHDASGNVVLTVRGISRFMVSLHFPSRSATIQLRSDKEGPQDIDATEATKLIREEYDLSRFN